ncbi:N-acetylmuramoyl-L-alanine amidase, partial [Candidatus Woesearchaeota archaeon]|nr:N-acetylmuramoyl-L-alanine amidase [Candidatus Woesearchaeota archaeon]
GTTLTPGAQLTLKYNTELSTLPPQTTEEQLNIAVAYYDDTQQRWIPLPTTLDRANKKATATITSLGLFTTITTSQAEQNPRQQPPHQDLQATIQGPSQTKPDQKEKYVANAKHQTAQGEYKKINKLEIWAKRQDGQDMQGCAEKKGKWCLLDRYAQQSEGTARRETETSLKEGKYTIAVNAYAEDRKCSGNPEPGWESCGVDSKIDVSVTTGIQTPGTQPSAGEPDHYPTFARFVDEYKLPNAKDIKNCCSTNARIYPEMAIPEEGQKSGCIRIVCEKTQADSKYYLAMYIKEEIKNDRQQPDTTGRCTGLKGNRDTNDFLARACGNTYAASPTTYRPSQTALDTYLQTRCPQLAGIGQCAMQTAAETGISPLILLAIPINEGACATNTISSDSKCPETGKQVNNLYGIKCARGQGTAGCCSYGTWEEIGGTRTDVTASFRAYNNKCESVKDFPAFLASSPRYEKALSAKNNPEEMIREMKNAGYATDSKWPDKIIMIMNQIKAAVGTETIHTSSETSGNIIQQLSPNHGGPMGEIKGVVIHSTRGLQVPGRELQAAVNWFMNPQSMVSAHRIIGVNGEQYKMVEDGITAWHAGEYNNNYLGIELEQGKPEDPYRDAQYRTAAQTVKEWSRKYGFPLTRNQNTKTVLGHDETTQGISIGKTDPGRKFNWNKFMSLLTEQENTR